jgi:hypothetical protein
MEKILQEILINKNLRNKQVVEKIALEQAASALPWLAE